MLCLGSIIPLVGTFLFGIDVTISVRDSWHPLGGMKLYGIVVASSVRDNWHYDDSSDLVYVDWSDA